MEIGIYIHIPFCVKKCNYCDFNSFSYNEDKTLKYFDALEKEILINSIKVKDYIIDTIFIGGGTPTIVDSGHIEKIMELIRNNYNLGENIEISIESNPGTINEEKLFNYLNAGINRISIGLQAWQENILKDLGRIHTAKEFLNSYKLARKCGFNNINIDLMFGIPGQTIENWEETLNSVIILNPEHLSCYSLKFEEGTVFWKMLKNGQIKEIDDEIDRQMYYLAIKKLKDNGYLHYEISNFSKKNMECQHNLRYWKVKKYLGFGAGAHSFFEDIRYSNHEKIEDYINAYSHENIPYKINEELNINDKISEYIILGLRLIEGINLEEFQNNFNINFSEKYEDLINKLKSKEFIDINENKIWLTSKGLDFANQVFAEFL